MSRALRTIRELLGPSQTEFAYRVGINRSKLSLIENGYLSASAEEEQRMRTELLHEVQNHRSLLDRAVAWLEGNSATL